MATKRKAKTALVLNPAGRSLSIGGSRRASNPARRRRRSASATSRRRRRNPVALKAVSRRRNPIRRRSNPVNSATSLVIAAVFAGLGVSVFDVAASRFLPQQSAIVRAGVKLGGAWAFQSYGGKLPVLGKYKNDIALVLAVSGVVDLFKLYLFPLVANAAGSVGLLIPAPSAGDDTTGNIYGNAMNANYIYAS